MAKLVQCIPNFSEGCRCEVVEAIVRAINEASGAKVVDYSLDPDHNRSVVTFLGEPEDIRRSALAGAKVAVELIDLTRHSGGHPRIGAVDVIPVVPVQDATMEEAVHLSYEIGRDIAEGLNLPVYFYERSALKIHHKNLAEVRRGGFETLRDSGLTGNREPDMGPGEVHPTAGAVVVGARGPLIAYNVNLATDDIIPARHIASKIRRLRDEGKGMAGVKAIAVYLRSRNVAQVSTNITLPNETSIWEVYSFIEREARELGVEVLESELIGAMREEAVLDAMRSAMKFTDLNEKRILDHWI